MLRDSWTVKLISEAALPARCGGGVEGAWDASVGGGEAGVSGCRGPSSGGLCGAVPVQGDVMTRSSRDDVAAAAVAAVAVVAAAAAIVCVRGGVGGRMGLRLWCS